MKHISEILKPGCLLRAKKLTKRQIQLINKTIKIQSELPKSIRFPYA